MKKILILFGVFFMLFVCVAIGGLAYIGTVGPPTFVVTGNQLDRRHVAVIHELELIEESEEIRYFYSDAMIDVRQGMYFLTDDRLVLYNENWAWTLMSAEYAAITVLEFEASDSWYDDSWITILVEDEGEWYFPVSAEKGKDRDFYRFLVEKTGGNEAPEPAPGVGEKTGASNRTGS